MPYIDSRLVHDADSHLMEMSDCLDPYFEKTLLKRFLDHPNLGVRVGNRLAIEHALKRQQDEEFRAGAADNIMLRKNYDAEGAFLKEDRSSAVDHIGVASQLVFTTFCLGNFGFDQSDDLELCYGAADAHNRMMTDFCSVDKRLLATAYVPLEDFDRAKATAKGCGLQLWSKKPETRKPRGRVQHAAFNVTTPNGRDERQLEIAPMATVSRSAPQAAVTTGQSTGGCLQEDSFAEGLPKWRQATYP